MLIRHATINNEPGLKVEIAVAPTTLPIVPHNEMIDIFFFSYKILAALINNSWHKQNESGTYPSFPGKVKRSGVGWREGGGGGGEPEWQAARTDGTLSGHSSLSPHKFT